MEKIIKGYMADVKEYFDKSGITHSEHTLEIIAKSSYKAKADLRKFFNADYVRVGTSRGTLRINHSDLLARDNMFVENSGAKRQILNYLLSASDNGITIRNGLEFEYYVNNLEQYLAQTENIKYQGRVKQMLVPGAKLSKLIAKLVQEDVVNIEYSKRLQAVKALELHIGIRPVDFVTMSEGNSWSSCHSIAEGGCYQAGPMSLMNDPYTVVAWAGNVYGKEWRQQFYIDPRQKLIVASRSYPNINEEATEKIKRFLKKLMFIEPEENIMIGRNSNAAKYVYSESSLFYNDIKEGATSGAFALYVKDQVPEPIGLGSDGHCPACGGYLDDNEYIYCCMDNDRYHCESCGDGVHEDEAYWAYDEVYCNYCYHEQFFYCESCDESHSNDQYREVEGRSICADCQDDYYTQDEYDEEYYDNYKIATFVVNGTPINISIASVMEEPEFDAFKKYVYEVEYPEEVNTRWVPKYIWDSQKPLIEQYGYNSFLNHLRGFRKNRIVDYSTCVFTDEELEKLAEVI